MRRMIVTGSEGFIGKALCRELTKRGVEVIGLDRKSGTEATKVCELLKNGGIVVCSIWRRKLVCLMETWTDQEG